MLALKVQNLNHKIKNLSILQNISLDLEEDKIACILGPSGCGKTTLLKLISGLENIQKGAGNSSTGTPWIISSFSSS